MWKKALAWFVILSVFISTGYSIYLAQINSDVNKNKVETPKPLQYKDLLTVELPISNQIASSPIIVAGKARGNWYFEASFPVQVLDEDGTVLGSSPVQA